ncbi:MAG: hypothetical protein KC546_16395 [Anaerolineae bacterium]|nr:hypothetical protein [Anaerolineae bacterium]MCA9889962.1 hypothetical protein [Anaerolineae bacterium]MCA9895635.1 hypothetical protein [Anaerolineae bacterium]
MEIVDLRLKTHDLEALRSFYDDLFDLALLDERDDEYFTVGAGETRLTFEQADPDEVYRYHFAFNIPNNQVAEANLWLASRVNLIEHNGEDVIEWESWNASALYFRDPVGNIVEFIARRSVDNDSDLPFSAQSIVRVSEIGLAVPDVPKAVAELKAALHLDVYDEMGDTFCALGSPRSLFIIVKEGHNWFPTSDTALTSPMTIGVRGEPEKTHVLSGSAYRIDVIAP